MKKIIASSVLALSLFPILVNAEEGEFPANMTVVKEIEIKKGATSDYPLAATLTTGQQVIILEEFKNSLGELWYRVDTGSLIGWGLSTDFTYSTPNLSLLNQDAYSKGANVNVRRGASTSYSSIGKLKIGQKVKVIDQHKNSNGELWYRINFNGNLGWVLGELLNFSTPTELETTKVIQRDNSHVRRGASTEYQSVATLAPNQKVNIIDEFKNSKGELWYRVDLGKTLGWVHSSAFDSPESSNPVTIKIVQRDNSSVRRGASSDYQSVATLTFNQKVNIIDEFKNSKGELWFRVDLGKIIGWVNSSAFDTPEPSYPVTTKVVQRDNSQVRRGASSDYQSVASLSSNQKVNIIDEFKNSKGELWYRVDLGKIIGWVNSSAFDTPEPSYPVTTKVVQRDNSQVRRGASTDYQSIATLSSNQKVNIIGEIKNSKGELWYRVDLGKILGWVESSVFDAPDKPEPSTPVSTKIVQRENSPVRRGASTEYESVATLSLNQKVTIIDELKNSKSELWYRVDLGNIVGWVHSSSFEELQPGAFTLTGTYYVGSRNANLYSGATYDYKIIDKLGFQNKLTVLSGYVNNSKQTWFRVKTTEGKIGWVPSQETVQSKQDIKFVYALNTAQFRRGASNEYKVIAPLQENEPLLVINKLNKWLNVETNSGIRGWIDEGQTSSVSLKGLMSPSTYMDGTANYLVWKKPTNFKFTYTTLSSNRLKLSNGISDVDLPNFKVKGIKSIETVQTTATEKSVILTFEPGYTFTIRDYKDKASIKVIPTGLLGKEIVVDAGHGGRDSGAVGPTGLKEKDVNLATALLLKAELERSGAIVRLTRSTDIFLELSQRTDIANSTSYDAFISIHADSFTSSSRGSTSYYNTTVNFNGPKSQSLASAIQSKMVSSLGTYNRGIKEQDFYVNRMNQLPSVLLELAFISNPNEEKLLRSQDFRQKAAEGVRKGLEDYFSNF